MSLFAGTVGTLGALGVLLALTFKGSPLYVMPLVFGFAPVVNTVVTMWLSKTFKQMNPIFVVGMVMVAIGAVGVLVTKPSTQHVAHATSELSDANGKEDKKSEESTKEKSSEEHAENDVAKESTKETAEKQAAKPNILAIILSIVMAAVCWGSYGPFLHIGQMQMGGSRLRPFFCVGIAYFAIAVAAPLGLLSSYPDEGAWSFLGMVWSIAAGTAGAIGALGIIMAFNFGGKPIFVMPLVFGFAPVVNTLVSMYLHSTMDKMRPEFLICLGIVVIGAVTVLLFAPKAKPHGAAGGTPVKPPENGPSTSTSLSHTPEAKSETATDTSASAEPTTGPSAS